MTEIDISKIKPGDTVTLRAVVQEIAGRDDRGHSFYVEVTDYASFWVRESKVASHEPAPEPLKVGDVVIHNGYIGKLPHTVIGLYKDKAWLYHQWDNDIGTIEAKLSDLRRVKQP